MVGNARIRWLGTKFATPVHFQSRSRVIPKCWVPKSRDFSSACEKIIYWRLGKECPNSMIENRICDTDAFSATFRALMKCWLPNCRNFWRACEKNISWHCGGECLNSIIWKRICDNGLFLVAFNVVTKCRLPRSWDFSRACKKIFLGIVERNSPIRCLGTEFATPTHFRSRSWAVPKCQLLGSWDFSHACEKMIPWRCGGECPNSIVGN